MLSFRKKYGCLFILWAACLTSVCAAPSVSETLSGYLTGKGLSPQPEQLSGSLSLLFPYNIRLSFGNSAEPKLMYMAVQDEMLSERGAHILDALVSYALYLTENPPEYGVEIVFTANDLSPLGSSPAGTRTLAETIETASPPAAVILRPGTGTDVSVICGIPYKTIPSWLLARLLTALHDTQIPYRTETVFLTFYRLGWTPARPLLSVFLDMDIPAAELEIPEDAAIEPFLEKLTDTFAAETPQEWDRHYSFFSTPYGPVFLSERVQVVFMILAAGIPLLLLFGLAFSFGKKRKQYFADFKKTWFILPVMILVTSAALFLSEYLVSFLFSAFFGSFQVWYQYPFFALFLKFIFSASIIAVFTLLQHLIRFPQDDYIYGFLVQISCFCNIVICSIADFSLTLLFVSEYLLAVLFSRSRRFFSVIVSGLLMFAPFVLYLSSLFSNTMPAAFETLFSGSYPVNLLFACIVLPFELIVFRILVKIKRFGKKDMFRVPYISLALITVSVLSCTAFFFLSGQFKQKPVPLQITELVSENGENSRTALLSAHAVFPPGVPVSFTGETVRADTVMTGTNASFPLTTAESQMDISTRKTVYLDRARISVHVDPLISAQRIDVSVSSPDGYAVYDANYPFEAENGGLLCRFTLDENPPDPLDIEFTSANDIDISVTVTLLSFENPHNIQASQNGTSNSSPVLYRETVSFHFPGT